MNLSGERRACFGQREEAGVAKRRTHRKSTCSRGIFNTAQVSQDNANVDRDKTKPSHCGQHTSISPNEIPCKYCMISWQHAVQDMQKGFTNEALVSIWRVISMPIYSTIVPPQSWTCQRGCVHTQRHNYFICRVTTEVVFAPALKFCCVTTQSNFCWKRSTWLRDEAWRWRTQWSTTRR